ncbi:hypothetical protein [Dickeya fangzhongdai]|uniref:hypothetical protein n=1 Tax=Dickeya fangzhongdai TaxID=1778540 RepID=UPI0004F6DDF6|nr:hypothetical protein [Dickeya fangzhongdai]AIR69920.1 hypothetical protein LH89_12155 [Dickeya fangzhongdai]
MASTLKIASIGKRDTKMLIICLQKTHFVITIITVMLLAGAMVVVASRYIDFFPKNNVFKENRFFQKNKLLQTELFINA